MESALEDERKRLARTEKRMADLQAETARPSDTAERPAWLQRH